MEAIAEILYRHLKGLPINADEQALLENWLAASENNRRTLESLSDETWLQQARERYFAAGKKTGLQQLREQLFNDHPRLSWWQRLKRCFN